MMFFSFCSVIFVFAAVVHSACGRNLNDQIAVSQRTRVSRIPPSLLRVGKRIEESSTNNEEPDYKRSPKFILFPRVGRTGLETWRIERVDSLGGTSGLQKRSEEQKNGLWFGPRLGRLVDNKNQPVDMPLLYTLSDDGNLQKLPKQYMTEEQLQDLNEAVTNNNLIENLENDNSVKENPEQYYERNIEKIIN